MNFIIENWYVILAAACIVAAAIVALVHFFKLPTKEQVTSVKEWLLIAVTEAEKALGGGTGQLKLRQVYDLFVQRFPWIAKVVAFSTFSLWVDEALEQMKNMLAQNTAAAAYVEGEANAE